MRPRGSPTATFLGIRIVDAASRTAFVPKQSGIARIQRDGYEAWPNTQFSAPPSRYPEFLRS
jgi:hypothetical protein